MKISIKVITIFHYLTLCYVIFLTLLLLLPHPGVLLFGWSPSEDVRDYSHLFSFMVLGFLFELDRRRFSFEFLGLVLLCYAICTEIGQIFFPPRVFDLEDIMQNFAGIVIGLEIGNIIKNISQFFIRFFCNKK
ncbi:MAG: VanZ family protein [Planctomycetaceae bacterium]|jgi:glycopeptide antibiotics resistance protein|nr:VanZ family protein [Planctomycetaceae bacterium]